MSKSILVSILFSALAFGCDAGSQDEAQETTENLIEAGFPASDIEVVEGKVYVGGDAEVSLQASREMLQTTSSKEQYRTNNLVGGPNPSVICVNGAAFTDPTLSAGLNLAIDNYVQEYLAGRSRLYFYRVNGGSIPGCTFFINGFVQPGLVGGFAGFPAGGAPYGQITIGGGLVPYGVDLVEHVITHELGHCIGFVHADYFDPRISCGPLARPSLISAIHIPGTPTGSFVGMSVMNSCFRPTENGEFTPTDIIALDVVY